MEELNAHQMQILNALIFKNQLRFTDLNVEKLTNDKFNYHLKSLIENDFVKKNTSEKYELTLKGKEYCGRVVIFSLKVERQAKIGMMPVCIKEENGEKFYLVHQRKKHPFFDFISVPSGKAKFGNLFIDEVLRELKEETGLKGTPVLKRIKHILVKKKGSSEIVEDKVFFVYLIKDLKGKLIKETIEGINYWMTMEEIFKQPLAFEDDREILESIEGPELLYSETIDEVTGF